MKFAKCLVLVLIKEHSLTQSKPKITMKVWMSDILTLLELMFYIKKDQC
jgi:hypothetical protein